MTNGPIKRSSKSMQLKKKKKRTRQQVIDDAVDAATAPAPKEKEEKKNPYPEGSRRAKYWARLQADRAKKNQWSSKLS